MTIHTAKYGPLQIANLYQDVYANDEQKYCHLARIWDRLRSKPGRPVIGDDFNMPPSKGPHVYTLHRSWAYGPDACHIRQ